MRKSHNVHRLVAEAFIPNPENKPAVNHVDGERFNNRVDNLEGCTTNENVAHATSLNLRNAPTGEFREDVKYNRRIVTSALDMYYKNTMTCKEIESELGIIKEYIALIVKGARWVGVYEDYIDGRECLYQEFRNIASRRRRSNMHITNIKLRRMYNEKLA